MGILNKMMRGFFSKPTASPSRPSSVKKAPRLIANEKANKQYRKFVRSNNGRIK